MPDFEDHLINTTTFCMFPEVIHTYPIGQKDTQTVCLVGGALLNWPIMIVTMLIKKATLTI